MSKYIKIKYLTTADSYLCARVTEETPGYWYHDRAVLIVPNKVYKVKIPIIARYGRQAVEITKSHFDVLWQLAE